MRRLEIIKILYESKRGNDNMGKPGRYNYRKKRKFKDWIKNIEREAQRNDSDFSIVYRMYEWGVTAMNLASKGKVKYIGKSDSPTTRYTYDEEEISKGLFNQARNKRKKFDLGKVDYCVIKGRWRKKWAAQEECIQYHKFGGKKKLKNSKHPNVPNNGCPVKACKHS